MSRPPITVTLSATGLPGGTSITVTVTGKPAGRGTGHRRQVEILTEDATRAVVAACGGPVLEIPPLGAQS